MISRHHPLRLYLSQQLANLILALEGLLAVLEARPRNADHRLSLSVRMQAQRNPDDLVVRINWINNLRWGVVLVVPLLIFVLSRQQGLVAEAAEGPALSLARLVPNLVLSGVTLLLNLAYMVALRRRRALSAIAHAMIVLDTLVFTLTIYSTGGVASPFTFVYFLPILAAALLISFNAGLLAALIASLLYTGVLTLQHHGWLPVRAVFAPLAALSTGRTGYTVLMGTVNVYAFFLVATLSGLLAQVLKRKELALQDANDALEGRVGELSLLFDVAQVTNRTVALDRVLKEILDLLVRRLEFDRALLYLVTPDGKALKLKLLSRHPRYKKYPPESYAVTMELKKTAGLTARAALERKLYNITDPLNHPLINRELAAKIGLNPFAVAPLLVRGRLVGVIGVDHKYQGGPISDAEARSLVIFASQAAQTIENARLASRGGRA